MSAPLRASQLPAGPALLERAVGHLRTCLTPVADTALTARTPCERWDLLALLRHVDDSLAALTDAAEVGYVDLATVPAIDPGPVLVDRLRERASALLAAWAAHPGTGEVSVSGRGVHADLLAGAGSLELAVHGWDIARACGVDHPVPAALAEDLLDVLPLLLDDADRPHRFAGPLVVRPGAAASARLLAALGRGDGGRVTSPGGSPRR